MADEENKVELNDDQFAKLADVVAGRIVEKMEGAKPDDKGGQGEGDPTPPAKTPEPNGDGGKGQAFSPKDVAAEVMKMFQQQNVSDANKVYETLFNEKYQSTVNSVPGLEEFLDGKDDYGRVRKDELMKLDDYETKLGALSSLTTAFSEASAGQSGRRPVVNTKARQKAQEAETRYSEVDDKLEKGEYNNIADFTKDFFGAIEEEMKGLN